MKKFISAENNIIHKLIHKKVYEKVYKKNGNFSRNQE